MTGAEHSPANEAGRGAQPLEASKPPEGQDPPGRGDPEETEIESFLGPGVRTPAGIPKQYRPLESSTHDLFKIELTDFAGPLDLLLFLIRKHDLDIFDIPISFITERYLEMLNTLESLPIDVAAEFLVMAAELAHIKSKMLLPPKEGVAVEDEEEEGDPRSDLVRRLLEYQKYRDAAEDLGDRNILGRDVFGRAATLDESDEDFDPGLRDTTVFRLVEAMAEVLSRLEPETQHEVVADTVNISDRINYIYDMAQVLGAKLTFRSLFQRLESRRVVVITFIAVLELARLRLIRITQDLAELFQGPEGEEVRPGELFLEVVGQRPGEIESSFEPLTGA